MALPRLNENPEYSMTIPSTGEQVNFRPFLVKEQKVLMIANESQDKSQILSAMLKTISSCTNDTIDLHKLATYDIDYMFTQIRAKSVGEKASVNIKCKECEADIPIEIDLSKVTVKNNSKSNAVKLSSNMELVLQHPNYDTFIKNKEIIDGEENTETTLNFMIHCMHSLKTEEENIMMKDESNEEKMRFLESLSTEQFEKIAQYIQNVPKITYDAEGVCESCNAKTNITLEGMENFF